VNRLRRSIAVLVPPLAVLTTVGIGAGAPRTQWVWPKSWAETQLLKQFPGTSTVCSPVGPATRKTGYNAYAEFACVVTLPRGSSYVLVLTPRSRAAWKTLRIEKTPALPPGGTTPAPVGSAGSAAVAEAGSTHRISDRSLDGSRLTLDDGSRWLVSPLGQYQSVLWPLNDLLAVLKGSDRSYPYELTDTRDGSSAEAKLLGRG
jgi:hypothetical protein